MMQSPKFWIGLVIGLLAINVCVGTMLVYFAHSDPSHVVEENYYDKALAWDEHRAQIARNEQLGWQVAIETPQFQMPIQSRDMRLRLVNPDGEPIDDASVEIVAFHNARANNKQSLRLAPGPEGGYSGQIRVNRPGWWQFEVVARSGGATFTDEQRIFIDATRK